MTQTALINLAGDIWVCVFTASFLSSFVLGAIQMYRGKELWDTRALPFLMALHFAWVLPLAAPLLVGYFAFRALGYTIGFVAKFMAR